nr:6-pyruvoyl-tetrahydropterin synthase-related protein [Paracidobacterium acidisoli]
MRHWHEGVAYPHWDASANYGAGEPRFVFYPPLSWLLGTLMGAVLPWSWAPLLFTGIALLALGGSFFAMAREWMSEDQAALAACLCVLQPYLLFVAYERAAYGELLAAAWIPLLILFGLRRKPALLPLAVSIAGVWLTDAPAAVMGCYALAVLVIAAAAEERSLRLIRRSAGAVPLGLGLAGFYLVPAMWEQRWVEITRAIGDGMRVEDSFLFGHTTDAYHDQVLRTVSWIAVALLLATTAAAWGSARKRKALWLPLCVVSALIAFLQLPFSDFLWRLAPELKFLQFPWRWLLVLGVVLAALAGITLRGEARTRRAISLRAISMLLFACLMAGAASAFFWSPCDDQDSVQAQRTALRGDGVEGTDEYTPRGVDNEAIQQGLPPVRVLTAPDAEEADSSVAVNPDYQASAREEVPATIHIARWQSERISLAIGTRQAAWAVLRRMNYPAWRILLNGKPVLSSATRQDGLIALPLTAGENRIEIRYRATADMWAGRIASLTAALVLLLAAAYRKKERKVQVS